MNAGVFFSIGRSKVAAKPPEAEFLRLSGESRYTAPQV